VAPGEAEVERAPVAERIDEDVGGVAARLRQDEVHVGLRSAERDHTAAKAGHVSIEEWFRVRDHSRAPAQLIDELGLGGGHVVHGAHELQVYRRDVGDHADIGQGDARELTDLPVATHRHLDDDDLGALLDVEERQRDADLVVQVGRGGHGARHGPEESGEDVFCGRLAGAAGDGHDLDAGAPAHLRAQTLQRRQPIVDDHSRGAGGQAGRGRGADHHRRRAGRQGLRGVGVAVVLVAAKPHEQLTARQAARVAADGADDGLWVAALEASATGRGDLHECQRQHALTTPRAVRPAALPRRRSRRTGSGARR